MFGPHPAAGERVPCRVRMRHVGEREVRADLELGGEGGLWAQITGWEDRRFDSDDAVWSVLMYPERHALAESDSDGYALATEHWTGAASRELMMRRYLGERERAEHERLGPRARRGWLLGRIAIKDAVRLHHWAADDAAGLARADAWPVEIEVANEPSGRPTATVRGAYAGRGALHVSVAHKDDVSVAICDPHAPPGIDVERVEARTPGFLAVAFTADELALGAGRDADEWHARLWAAKEAVAKARGTGITDPRALAVRAVDGERLYIDEHAIETRRRGAHAIAWTPPARQT
jgi:phosphopantetheinyl transferase (holo-ACP synthase)